ncbi:non-hydrolyzing UDP-N-acetylglucosamine 2-epimerase [Halonatronum saccharophilum]|uniref:non-hydrolyzing UDP-N-acetylglucosamine 2-epimerase n=1 Tax=Halonatronum saccharophilum TaxID=150060 RepID=UPI000481461E|nr:UDP-N-acetylglucosamine 2-epimerase (non-hydrolyzing) [Halonatronum saccharophilum]
MDKLKVMTVFGTRPEAIKMAPVIKALKNEKEIKTIVTVTGQHREMLDSVLKTFSINTDYDLDIMEKEQTLSSISSKILDRLDHIIVKESPDLVLVHGDTTSTLMASLVAFYHQVKLAHIEAGLRSEDKYSPFPEEINRRLVGGLADVHFAPTLKDKGNLLKEGIAESSIVITGNTVIDSLLSTVDSTYSFNERVLRKVDFTKKVILLTLHRRENLGSPMKEIFKAIKDIVEQDAEVEVVYPMHLNPKIQKSAKDYLKDVERVHLLPPLDYKDFVNLMAKSYFILTDSGGIQEEGPSLDKPVLVLRDNTERIEGLEAGCLKLIGRDREGVVKEVEAILNSQKEYKKIANVNNPYGDGKASERILEKIKEQRKSSRI